MRKLSILLVLILVSCIGQPKMITSKHETKERYCIRGYKYSTPIDSTLYETIKKTNPELVDVSPARYWFILDGKVHQDVDAYTYKYYTEGDIYKEIK